MIRWVKQKRTETYQGKVKEAIKERGKKKMK